MSGDGVLNSILLINPPETEQSGFTNPPLGLLYLAGMLLAHGFEVRVLDCCIEGENAVGRVLEELRPSIVGITCLTPMRRKALEVAQTVKKHDSAVKVVLGGAHPTIMHRQMLGNYPFIDCIVIGEGEHTLLEIAQGKELSQISGIAYRDGGGVEVTHPRRYVDDLDSLPFPAWHLLDLRKYPHLGRGTFNGVNLAWEPRVSVIFSRGCTGHCSFCSTWWIWRGWRRRSPGNMADELELLYGKYGIRHFCFADDTMTVDGDATVELCDEIVRRRLKIAFSVTTRADCVDGEILRRLRKAGCYEVAYGVETGSPSLLAGMGKGASVEASEEAIRLTKKVGIRATALMIVGNVGETWDTVRETVSFLRRAEPDGFGCVGGLWVLPGTRLYAECVAKGFIDDNFWLGDEPYKLYTLEHTPEELRRMRRTVAGYSLKAWLRTLLEFMRR